MTDRIRQLTITLDRDYREDDVKSIVSAIVHIRGVADVQLAIVTEEDHIARLAIGADLKTKLHKAIDDIFRQDAVRKLVDK